jgi:hypothetical protein
LLLPGIAGGRGDGEGRRSHSEVPAQQPFCLVEHGVVTGWVVAEGEAEQVVADLDSDEAADLQAWVRADRSQA